MSRKTRPKTRPNHRTSSAASATPPTPPTAFVVKLRSCRTEADNVRTLRWILKRLLRGYRLRCVSISEERAP